jgi:Phosphotransferase enzyme family
MGPTRAAVTVARRYGLVVEQPVVLSDSNNVVVWLAPSSVVAKVGTGHHGRLDHELAVAKHLTAVRAPIVAPADEVPREVHVCDGFEVTFWEYHPRQEQEVDPRRLAHALFELHEGLASYGGDVHSYRAELEAVHELLAEGSRVTALKDSDRTLLVGRLDALLAVLGQRQLDDRVLHGSPHDLNVIVVAGAPRFVDLETVCVGPLEWDLAHAGTEVANAYPSSWDPETLQLCNGLVSVKTAAWCWARVEHPGMRWHAEHHLALVRHMST